MGTSSSGSGAGGSNPLVPSWIPPVIPPQQAGETDSNDQNQNDDSKVPDRNPMAPVPAPAGNRFKVPKEDFNKFVRSGGRDTSALKQSLKGYARSAGGRTSVLATRMRPSAVRIVNFYNAVNAIRENGLSSALIEFNLGSYVDKSLLETLSALSDVIFSNAGELYEDTQDDSITQLAYANTVVRVCEGGEINLDTITNDQIEIMTAIFIEETIAQRVICDIGNKLTDLESNVETLLQIEENAYQIINGLVRTQIMPEITATQRSESKDLNSKIEEIYRIAFDALAGN